MGELAHKKLLSGRGNLTQIIEKRYAEAASVSVVSESTVYSEIMVTGETYTYNSRNAYPNADWVVVILPFKYVGKYPMLIVKGKQSKIDIDVTVSSAGKHFVAEITGEISDSGVVSVTIDVIESTYNSGAAEYLALVTNTSGASFAGVFPG